MEWKSIESWGLWSIPVVLGLGSTYYFYRRGKQKQEVLYQFRSSSLISRTASTIPALTVQVGGSPVNRLAIAWVVLWNNGNAPISTGDFAKSRPLSLHLETEPSDDTEARVKADAVSHDSVDSHITSEATPRILSAKVEAMSLPENQVEVEYSADDADSSQLRLTFDFLAPGNGAIVSLVYDPMSDLSTSIRLDGRLRNGSSPRQLPALDPYSSTNLSHWTADSIFFLVVGASQVFQWFRSKPTGFLSTAILLFAFAAIPGLIAIDTIRKWRRRLIIRLDRKLKKKYEKSI